ncbi:MAG: alpha-L-fucosidase [Phycisphaeraceae bacterium]|nr:alpha-L-fucosidase [Phycisphaeraceae bacterium]
MSIRFRQIHLDFHTGPAIPDVGCDFDATEFAQCAKEAHVNSMTLFAKCHHGHLYYDTKSPARHPGLRHGLDLLGEQIEALHSVGIRAPIYISVQCDEYAANTQPGWRAVAADGRLVGGGPTQSNSFGGWHILDMSSPYADYLADQIVEVCKKFKPVDGMFLDMCWDQESVSRYATDGMLKLGLNPDEAVDRKKYAHHVALGYMARYKKLIEDQHKGKKIPVVFNSRSLSNLVEEAKYLRHVEIEALPSGGWGYMYFPINVRFARNFGLPTLGMTARFHKGWADFGGLKTDAALLYECTQMLSQGSQCSVGDQLHPRGILDKAAYELIGRVYSHVEACEPWCSDAKPCADIGVIFVPEDGFQVRPGGGIEGVVRALQQLKHQFDFLPPTGSLTGYDLIIVPESVKVDAALTKKLKAHLKAGGSLLVTGHAALDEAGKPIMSELGVACSGVSPYTTTYLRFDRAIQKGIAEADHVMYEQGLRLTPLRGSESLGRVVEPYFERNWRHFSSHAQTPYDKMSRYSIAVQKDRVITIAYPIFTAYASHGNLPYRHLIAQAIDRLLPDPLLRVGGPSFLEASVLRQGSRHIVHLLSFAPQRRTQNRDIVEDPTPIIGVPISLKLPQMPQRVYLAPEGKEMAFTYEAGRVSVKVTHDRGHVMVVFE